MTAKDNKIDKKIYAQLIPVIIGGVLCFAILIHTLVLVSQKSKETAGSGSETGTETGTDIVWHAYPYPSTDPSLPPISPPVNNRHEDETEKHIYMNPEIAKLFEVPEEVLDSSTYELLKYFLNSEFIEYAFTSAVLSSSIGTVDQMVMVDITRHEAFRELVARRNLLPEMEKYAENLHAVSWSYPHDAFRLFLNQEEVRARVEKSTGDYPNLRAIYEDMDRGR